MSAISEDAMRGFLSKSISSINLNKIRGLLAEVDFRTHLQNIGYGERVSPGGWIARRNRDDGRFGHPTSVFFPEIIEPGRNYEIESVETRALVGWWFITFEQLARYASWVPQGGGRNMGGGGSTVVKIPKSEFTALTSAALDAL